MRQVTRKGLMTVAAATGVIAAAGGYAHADSGASGSASNSPGVGSGNNVQVPVHVPVNVCGNTVDVIGVLNPSVGNSCANRSAGHSADKSGGGHTGHGGGHSGSGSQGGSGAHSGSGGAQASGSTSNSPGVGSGNNVQAPVHVPVNLCGNSVDVVGILNPTMGNDCANDSGPGREYGTPPGGQEETPGNQGPAKPAGPGKSSHSEVEGTPAKPGHVAPAGASSVHSPQLAQTGSGLPLGLALPAGAGALLAGAVLYRKARASV
ncbi:chaplin [Streptomyces phaeoluteigriseus]|uniref:Chaplin n=1 Tax=Streptomyces phaeoluteigriseus TaxID=114686 RepID=A0ABY4ZEE8_9ACTN|nr:chaplin [Streptomyces phaeoluteigriseus]USQ87382.1 chaplin [Streptomyces phaeoluteigriseus]